MTDAPVRLTVNGEPREAPAGLTVDALLAELDVRRERCAVEVNRAVVPRSQHADHVLADGDVVEIVSFVGGG